MSRKLRSFDADGIGGGIVGQVRYRGFNHGLYEFHGGRAANDPTMHFNLPAQVWCEMRDWLKNGAQIPDDPELAQDLCSLGYGFSAKGAIQLERKGHEASRPCLTRPRRLLGDEFRGQSGGTSQASAKTHLFVPQPE